jgi:hypothetical protein
MSDSIAQTHTSLFSSMVRIYDGPRSHTESDYAFLDRSARTVPERVRGVLEEWYRELPAEARDSIGNRFRSSDPGHHLGALWELYMHAALFRLDYDIDLDIGSEDPGYRRPDFLVSDHAAPVFYLEATAVLGAEVLGDHSSRSRTAALKEAINRVKAPGFFVLVDVVCCGHGTPGRRHVTDPLQRWLDREDPDAVLATYEARGELPSTRLQFDGWDVQCEATPVSIEHRDDPDHRVLGSYSEGIAILDDAKPLRRNLKHKAGHYGQLNRPYIVALLCAGDFADDRDIADALLGSTAIHYHPMTGEVGTARQPDGFWHGPKGPQNRGVSAVITAAQLNASAITATEPTVWLNPWASRALTDTLPWRTQRISTDGHFETIEATRTAAQLFDLAPRWPIDPPMAAA